MRKIINSTYISLDGVTEGPHHWPDTLPSDERATAIQTDLLLSCDAVLMGRRTYDGFAPAWTSRSGDPVSDRMNSMRKYVVSSTLRDPDWNNTVVIGADPVDAIRQLKQEDGMDIVQYGFGVVTHALVEQGLLDELRLWVYPFLIGKGGPGDLLYRDNRLTTFTLVESTPLRSGIVVLRYAVAS
jgi:dihydrofolate reductase